MKIDGWQRLSPVSVDKVGVYFRDTLPDITKHSIIKVVSSYLCIHIVDFKGKGTQKYKWILPKSIWKTAHFGANCIKIGFLFFKILRFDFFKMAANGGRHFEINIKTENY